MMDKEEMDMIEKRSEVLEAFREAKHLILFSMDEAGDIRIDTLMPMDTTKIFLMIQSFSRYGTKLLDLLEGRLEGHKNSDCLRCNDRFSCNVFLERKNR